MQRRSLLKQVGATSLLPILGGSSVAAATDSIVRRVRPSDPAWPPKAKWTKLNVDVGGKLIKVESPLAPCHFKPNKLACQEVFRNLKNPYYLGDQVGLTGTTGWLDGWTSVPSVYAVAANRTSDVVAAVNFARENNLRLVVKGGGHSYQGTSDAPDSLLIWTRPMNDIVLHDAFVGMGCATRLAPQPAVTIGAGAIWMHVYEEVMAKAGRYVQGGGCATVGVAGLVQSGGFGNFSKNYGTAASSLLEAEVVTADGAVRIVNACQDPDLFWALKGGGGGTFGVVTRVTLKTHDMPAVVGAAFMTIKARSDPAYRRLIRRYISFYKDSLFNPHWVEEVHFRPDNTFEVAMVFQRLDESQAQAVWRPFLDWVSKSADDFAVTSPAMIMAVSGRDYWSGDYLRTRLPHLFLVDDRPGAPPGNVWSVGDAHEASQFMHGYGSAWLPASLLNEDQQQRLADVLFAASRHWAVGLHCNKGLAGGPSDAIAATRDTAMNPAVLDAFALAICGASSAVKFPDIRGYAPDLTVARQQAIRVNWAMIEILRVVPSKSAYVSEANYFQEDWQQSYWGSNYERLAAVKKKYDPDGHFFVRNGVGSEGWTPDGFTRLHVR